MTLTADSGSTKTTWVVSDGNTSLRLQTQGINPYYITKEKILDILENELIKNNSFPNTSAISEIYFYGAGCNELMSPAVADCIKKCFPTTKTIEVGSDMLGAARALFNKEEGIACILGTGANSCLYDGHQIIENVSPMGYILGDEGSGAVIGKTFVNLLYKGGHKSLIDTFEKETGLNVSTIINKVYREEMPNRFLASLAPFIRKHISEPWIEDMTTECFSLFFRRNIKHYNRPDLACSFVGSIAYFFEPWLRKAASQEGYIINEIRQEPL